MTVGRDFQLTNSLQSRLKDQPTETNPNAPGRPPLLPIHGVRIGGSDLLVWVASKISAERSRRFHWRFLQFRQWEVAAAQFGLSELTSVQLKVIEDQLLRNLTLLANRLEVSK